MQEEAWGLCLKLSSRFCPAVYKKPKDARGNPVVWTSDLGEASLSHSNQKVHT